MNEPHEKRTAKNLGWLKNDNTPCDLRSLPRCAAQAKSSGKQCGNPAMRGKRVCWIHGGRSTGPRTIEGALRSQTANLKHGNYAQATIEWRKHFNSLIRDYKKLLSEIK